MSTRMLRLGAIASLLPLAACVNMSGLGGGSKYSCAAPEGVACDSVSGTYANALHENLPSQRALGTAPGDSAAPASKTAAPTSSVPHRLPIAAPKPWIAGIGDTPALALRSQAQVLRLWVKPWEDLDGDLWDQSDVYVRVDDGSWQIDHVRQRIRDQYAPLRPPPAAPSAGASSLSGAAAEEPDASGASEGAVQRPASLNPFPSLSRPPAEAGDRPQ